MSAEKGGPGPDKAHTAESGPSDYDEALKDLHPEPEVSATDPVATEASPAAPSGPDPVVEARARLDLLSDPMKTNEKLAGVIHEKSREKIDPLEVNVEGAKSDLEAKTARVDRTRTPHTREAAEKRADKAREDLAAEHKKRDEAIISESDNAQAAADRDRELGEAHSERDVKVAEEMAYAEKGPREQAMALEQAPVGRVETEREQASREKLAVELRTTGTERGQAAGAAEHARLDAVQESINTEVKKSSDTIHTLASATEPGGIQPIGVNDKVDSATVESLSARLQQTMGVDASKAPFDSIARRDRLFGPKFIDVYRQSNEAELRGVVFVERYDAKTGLIVRLDVVSAPKPKIKEGKDAPSRRAMRKWRQAVESELEDTRHLPLASVSETNPFAPSGDPKLVRRDKSKARSGGYAGILEAGGMDRSAATSARNPKRGWWFSLFG
jgi:hypothetical protein